MSSYLLLESYFQIVRSDTANFPEKIMLLLINKVLLLFINLYYLFAYLSKLFTT